MKLSTLHLKSYNTIQSVYFNDELDLFIIHVLKMKFLLFLPHFNISHLSITCLIDTTHTTGDDFGSRTVCTVGAECLYEGPGVDTILGWTDSETDLYKFVVVLRVLGTA